MVDISKHHTTVWVYVALAIVTIVAYAQVLEFDFVGFDDPAFTTENDLIKEGLTLQGIIKVFSNPDYYCMQLSVLSHMLDCELFGLDPGRHHLTNLIFHIANVLLLFLLLKKLSGEIWPSAVVAVLFAVHPLNVESVAWIAERRNMLSTFFWFLTTLAYIRYTADNRSLNYLLIIIFFILGLMSKAMLVTLPFTLFLFDFWPLKRIPLNVQSSIFKGEIDDHALKQDGQLFHPEPAIPISIRRCIVEKIPLIFISIAASYLTLIAAQNTGGAPGIGGLMTVDKLPLDFRIANALVSYSSYLMKTVWPFGLSLNYPLDKELALWKIISALLLLAAVTINAFQNRRAKPWLAVGWLWYLGTLIPVIGIVQLGHQAMADRYIYTPLIGIFIMAAWTAADWIKHFHPRKKEIGLVAVILVALLMTITWLQSRYWKNTVSLFKHVIEISPNYTLAYYNLGVALRRQGKLTEAFQYFSRATEMAPEFAEANFFMALFFSEMNQVDQAITYYHKALTKKPDMTEARFNLALLFVKTGRWEEGEILLKKILSTKPDDAETFNALGNLYAQKNQTDEAIQFYLKAIQNNPRASTFHKNLGAAYEKKEEFTEALKHYAEAIRLDSSSIGAYNNIAVLLFKNGRVADAFRYFETALRINPNHAQTYYNMAVSYSRLNHIDEAIRYYTKTIEIDASFADAQEKRDILLKNK